MTVDSKLEIHFYDQDRVAIHFESEASSGDLKYAEILMFSCYAVQQLIALGKGEISRSLASQLSEMTIEVLKEWPQAEDPGEPVLVECSGEARKRFVATLRGPRDNFAYNFHLDAKGFGVFASGVGYYAPVSVVMLLKYLADRRSIDLIYLTRLALAAENCGRGFLGGAVKSWCRDAFIHRVIDAVWQGRESTQWWIDRHGEILVDRAASLADAMREGLELTDRTWKNVLLEGVYHGVILTERMLYAKSSQEVSRDIQNKLLLRTHEAIQDKLGSRLENRDRGIGSLEMFLGDVHAARKRYQNAKLVLTEGELIRDSLDWQVAVRMTELTDSPYDAALIFLAQGYLVSGYPWTRDFVEQVNL
jgi:hypothetical protein